MKTRVIHLTEEEIRKKTIEEFEKCRDELYLQVTNDVLSQFMAVCLYELSTGFKFGKKRLQSFEEGVNDYFKIMSNGGFLGKDFSTNTCINYIKDKYDIDLTIKEVSVKDKKENE